MIRGCAIVFIPLLTAIAASSAQSGQTTPQPEVEILASQKVNNREQRVIFRLDSARAGVTAVAIRTGSEAVQLQSLEIAYANGDHRNVELLETILPGRQSRLNQLDVASPIVEIVVWKRPGLTPGETTLQLLTTRQQAPRREEPMRRPFQVLDSQNVDQRGERISFRLGRGEHRYLAIKLRPLDDPLTITRAEIQFEDGQKQDFKVFIRVEPGKETSAFEIPGEPRQIERITAWKLPSTQPGRTGIELLGIAAPKR